MAVYYGRTVRARRLHDVPGSNHVASWLTIHASFGWISSSVELMRALDSCRRAPVLRSRDLQGFSSVELR